MMASSSRASGGSEEVEVSGRGRGIRVIDLPAVFSTPEEREMLCVITAFDLSRNELEELTNLQPLRSLTRLNVSYNRISFVDGLPLRLTQLNLAHNKLEHLDQVGELLHLRELDVSFNRLSSLAGLHPRVPLEVLRADDNRIDSTFGLKEMRSLCVVSLSNNYVESLDELMFVSTTPSLQLLNLVGNPVTRARQYRQTLAELQPHLVSLDGLPLTRPSDHEKAVHSPRVNGSGAPLATVHASPPLATPRRMTTARSPRATSRASSDSLRKSLAAVKTLETRSAAVMSPAKSINASSSHRGGGRSCSSARASIEASSISLDDSPNAHPRDQPPRPARRPTTGPISPPLRQPVEAVPRAHPSGARCATAEPHRHHSAPAELPLAPRESPAGGAQHTRDAHDASDYVGAAVEDSQVGRRSADASLRTPEQGSRQVGYASLHYTPAKGSSADCPRSGGRGRSFLSPALPQRTVALQQDLDSTIAKLHDSLVAKEQLEKECQALRQACKRAEGHLTEARRVISQQLAELSQLRLERDALRQSEGAALERLEKEKRAARTRASHHSEEVATLQAQYERMKTFYETQLADTRRELAAERARLLRRRNSNNGGGGGSGGSGEEQKAIPKARGGVAGRSPKLPLRDEGQCTHATAGSHRGKVGAAVPASPARSLSPMSRSALSSPAETAVHDRSVTTPSTDTVAQQLTSWLYASLTGDEHPAEGEKHVSGTVALGELRRSLLRDAPKSTTTESRDSRPPPQGSSDSAEDGVVTAATAARRILQAFIAQHTAEPTRPAPRAFFDDARAQSPAVRVAPVGAPTEVDADGGALLQMAELEKCEGGETAAVCPLPPQLPSPARCRSPPPADHISLDEDDDHDVDSDADVTVVITPPAFLSAPDKEDRVAAADLPAPPQPPLLPHDERVNAARALLKGMESLFDTPVA
ncbi:hypothetical protein JKF63_07702 [Porcisia hertigi]|uniref:Uncharacterized protein n=1 Tax=Porcisia hertigi TaxID=2761500 RepID=A0A836YHX4_9TRYP|nr:hypothetical protein JKF63_07702 [Porcisia hertigi]